MPGQRDFHFTRVCMSQLLRHPEFRDEILEMVEEVLRNPNGAIHNAELGTWQLEHSSPRLVFTFMIEHDGSISFRTFIGPNT